MGTPRGGYWHNNVKLVSVTQALGRFKDSKQLIAWAYRQGREHENMRARGIEDAPTNLYDKVQEAANAGTIAHNMIEGDILDTPYTIPEGTEQPVIVAAQAAFEAYRRWRTGSKLTITDTELGLKSTKHMFGGTLDALGLIDGKTVMIDWKTSNGVYSDYLIQVAAYAMLVEENTGQTMDGGFHLLRVSKTSGSFNHHHWPYESIMPLCGDQFLDYVRCYYRDYKVGSLLR